MSDFNSVVLGAVDLWCTETSGYSTGGIASLVGRQPGSESNRQHVAKVGAALRELERAGAVGRMDDQKPVIWVRGKGRA